MAVEYIFKGLKRPGPIFLGLVWIDRTAVKQLTGCVYHGQLAPGAVTGVYPKHCVPGKRCLAQQRAQVLGKDLNGMAVGALAQRAAHIALDRR